EKELDPVPQRCVEGVGEVSAPDLEVEAGLSAGHLFGPYRADRRAGRVHEGDLLVLDVHLAQPGQQAHTVDDLAGRAADVDRVPAATDGAGLLDDGHLEAVPVEPVRERGARDARSREQDAARAARRAGRVGGRRVHGGRAFPPGGARLGAGTRGRWTRQDAYLRYP